MTVTYHSGRRIQGISRTARQAGSGLTFSDDFSSDKGWDTSNSTYMDYDSGNSRLKTEWHGGGAGSNKTVVYDLGEGMVSDTKWILRMKINFGSTDGADNEGFIGLSDSDETAGRETAQDFAGVCFLAGYSTTAWNGFYECEADGVILPPTAGNNAAYNFSDSTDYYLEIKRTSATGLTYTVYSDAYSTSLATQSVTIASTVSGLRYIKFANYPTASTNQPGAYADDIQFYNDVTSTSTTPVAEVPASGDIKPTNVQVGSKYEETDTRKIYYRIDSDYETDKWFELGTIPYAGGRGVFSPGYRGSNYNVLDYVTISTLGNATDFGDLSVNRRMGASVANKTRGVFAGGYSSTYVNTIDYITISTPGNATDFGDMPDTQTSGMTGAGNNTRGIFAGGETSYTNRMAYITIDTTSNTTNFGNLTAARKGLGATSDGTKAVFCGGEGAQTTMDYVTIGTTGNAQSWGTFSAGSHSAGGGVIADGTKGLFVVGGSSSGASYSDVIEYITFATTGNSVDFGNLTEGRASPSCCSSDTRGLIGGGKYTSGGTSSRDTIDYITIATTGNAADFGDLTQSRYATMGGVSDTGAEKS